MTGFLPADGATTRLHKLNHLVEYCASFSRGCTESQLLHEGLKLGNTSAKILEYIITLNNLGLISRRAEYYFVDEMNYREWAEAKGYRERTYIFKCPNPDCPASYGSTLAQCPTCHTPNPFLNEPPHDTHTQDPESISINKNQPQGTTTEPNTHTYTPTPRQRRVREGKKAEMRVVELLNRYGGGGAGLGKGQGGSPDVIYHSDNALYAVEVKSIEHQVRVGGDRYKASTVPLSVGQWRALCDWAGEDHSPLLVVEVKIRGSKRGHLYHFISAEVVNFLVDSSESKHIRISVHDLSALSFQSVRPGLPLSGGWLL